MYFAKSFAFLLMLGSEDGRVTTHKSHVQKEYIFGFISMNTLIYLNCNYYSLG